MLVAGIAGFAGNAAIAGICVIASSSEGTGLSGGGGSASLRGSRWVGASASSERPLAAIAIIAGNSAIAGNDGAVSEPVLASTTACSHQAAAYLRTFNPKVVGSSPTGGTAPASAPEGTGVFFIPGAPAAALACCSVGTWSRTA